MNELEKYKKRFFVLTESTLGDVKPMNGIFLITKEYKETMKWAKSNGFISRYMDISSTYIKPEEKVYKIEDYTYDFFKIYEGNNPDLPPAYDLSEIRLSVYLEAGDDVSYGYNTNCKAVLFITTTVGMHESDLEIIKSKFPSLNKIQNFPDKFFMEGSLSTSDVLSLSFFLEDSDNWVGPDSVNNDINIT
jgi:hypothetical protein